MKKLLLVLALGLASSSFAASLHSLSKSEVLKTLTDKTITTAPIVTMHDSLLMNNSASLYFDKSGSITGRFASKPDNDPQADQGTWKVDSSGKLCVTWKTWTKDKPICVMSYKVANGLIFINTDNKFETMVPLTNIENGNQVH